MCRLNTNLYSPFSNQKNYKTQKNNYMIIPIHPGNTGRPNNNVPYYKVNGPEKYELPVISAQLKKHMVRFQERNDETSVKEAYIQFCTQLNQIVQNYYTLSGKNAYESYQAAMVKIHQLQKDDFSRLPNIEQKKIFSELSIRRSEYELDAMTKYALQERRKWLNDVSHTVITNSTDFAARNWNNKDIVKYELDNVISETRNLRETLSDDTKKLLLQNNIDNFWQEVITAAIQADPAGSLAQLNNPANYPGLDHNIRLALINQVS